MNDLVVFASAAIGAFVGGTGARGAMFILRTAVRLGWNGLHRALLNSINRKTTPEGK